MHHKKNDKLGNHFEINFTKFSVDYCQIANNTIVSEEHLLQSINNNSRKIKINILFIIGVTLLSVFLHPAFILLFFFCIPLSIWDKKRRTTLLDYSLKPETITEFQQLIQSIKDINTSNKVWTVNQSQHLHSIHDQKRNAGAGNLVKRVPLSPTRFTKVNKLIKPFYIKTTTDAILLREDKTQLLFLPEIILVSSGKIITALPYEALTVHARTARFMESGGVPRDGEIVDYTWQFVNINGTPDKRFKNNRKIPVLLYGELTLQGYGRAIEIQTSNNTIPFNVKTAFSYYNSHLKQLYNELPLRTNENRAVTNSSGLAPLATVTPNHFTTHNTRESIPGASISDGYDTPNNKQNNLPYSMYSHTQKHFENTPLSVRLQNYKEKRRTRNPQTEDDVIDISNIMPPVIARPTHNYAPSPSRSPWFSLLQIPYERSVMQNSQVKEETLRLYEALCIYTDGLLQRQNKSLANEIMRLKARGGYYDNLAYTFYCIAEGHVTQGYSGRSYYNNDYSYQILEQHLGIQSKKLIQQKALELEKSILPPSAETCREFHLTENGLPILWWDKDGLLRSVTNFSKTELSILNSTPARDTKIWDLLPLKQGILSLYLTLWKIIQAELTEILTWKKMSLSNIEKIINGSYSYSDYNERTNKFLASLLKMSENVVRAALPKSSYTQDINVEQDQHLVGLFLPKECFATIAACLLNYKEQLPNETLINMLTPLSESEAGNWRITAELLLQSNRTDWIPILTTSQSSSDYTKLLREIIKSTDNNDLLLLALYVQSQLTTLTPALFKRVEPLVYSGNLAAFEDLVSTSELSEDVLNKLLALKEPIRKRIQLSSSQIEKSKQELIDTVSILSEPAADEEAATHSDRTRSVRADFPTKESRDEPTPSTSFSDNAVQLVQTLLDQRVVGSEELNKQALSEGKLLNSYISEINQEFYEHVGDQLLLIDNDVVKIDDFYIDLAKELLAYER